MNTETLAIRIGADWNDIARTLDAAGLDAVQIESVRTVRATINNRLTRSLGRVKLNRVTGPTAIELAGQMVRMGERSEIIEVFLHEVAHLATDFLLIARGRECVERGFSGESAHGPTWCRFARALGVPAKATMKTSYRAEVCERQLKTVAVCASCGFELKKARRLNRRRNYTHRGCGIAPGAARLRVFSFGVAAQSCL